MNRNRTQKRIFTHFSMTIFLNVALYVGSLLIKELKVIFVTTAIFSVGALILILIFEMNPSYRAYRNQMDGLFDNKKKSKQ